MSNCRMINCTLSRMFTDGSFYSRNSRPAWIAYESCRNIIILNKSELLRLAINFVTSARTKYLMMKALNRPKASMCRIINLLEELSRHNAA